MTISPDKQDITITDQRQGRPALHRHRRSSSRATTSARKTTSRRWSRSSPASPTAPRRWPRRPRAFVDRFGTFGYAFAQVDARPEIDRANGQVVGHAGRRAAAPRLRAAHQRRRQHAHARRGDAARVPPVRVVVVRRPQDQAVARPGRPARLLQRGQRRHQRGAGHAGPGRPDDHDQGEAHRQPARSAPASRSADKLSLDGVDQAGERLRLGQLPRASRSTPASSHRTLVLEHGRPVLHDRRHLARVRPLLPHAASRSTARARSTSS